MTDDLQTMTFNFMSVEIKTKTLSVIAEASAITITGLDDLDFSNDFGWRRMM